jgi:hypothetical protein
MALNFGAPGLVQRIAVVCQIAWLALLAWSLRSHASAPSSCDDLQLGSAGPPR